MYLKEIYLENTGPISKCHIKPLFDNDGKPLPVVIVGPNGSGKTTFLSYIVDALTEFAKKVFDDIVPLDGLNQPYFRVIHPRAIKSGQPFSLSLLHFNANDDGLYYCEKSGVLNPETYSPDVKSVFAPVWKWPMDENHKKVSGNTETIKDEMRRGAYAFFPSNRREIPAWLNPRSLQTGMNAPVNQCFNNELGKPLHIETCADEIIGWILDVFLDAAIDYDIIRKLRVSSNRLVFHNLSEKEKEEWNNSRALQLSLQNIEQILQKVLRDKQAKLLRRLRSNSERRLSIQLGNGQEIPNLQSLSEGESQLFHLFATIIRYGEHTNLNKGIRIADITGLVIVDEIDAHLHPTFQHDVLPKLIKLFPKVQFIVSSHSPLFPLGMEKEFGPGGLAIHELPDGHSISSERFSEFGKAFEYYQDTERFEGEIKQLIVEITKPTVLTEGKLDAYYIQKALELLGEGKLLNTLEIRPVGKKGKKGDENGGKDGLNRVLNFHKKDSSLINQPMLLLYDSDVSKDPEQIEKLWIRSIQPNPENAKIKKGIENLFSTDLFEKRFYKTEIKEGDYGECNKIDEFKKKEFCQWICEERKNPDDFEKFDRIVKILKEFVEALQPSTDQ